MQTFFAGLDLYTLGCGAAIVFAWVTLAVMVYSDARDRGLRRPALWAGVTLVGGLFGLMLYVLFGVVGRPGGLELTPPTREPREPREPEDEGHWG